jgi:hypothetical protein
VRESNPRKAPEKNAGRSGQMIKSPKCAKDGAQA